jgi:hypothetical protein
MNYLKQVSRKIIYYRLIFCRNWGRLKNPSRELVAGLLMTSSPFLAVKLRRGKELPAGHNF